MQINWFTFGAQIVNFLVLVWLLKRLLYIPITRAMEDRQQQIAAKLQSAADERQRATEATEEYARKLDELKHTREQLLAEAAESVRDWKATHIRMAQDEVDAVRSGWLRILERDKESFRSDMRLHAAAHVQQVARHVLGQLANRELEDQTLVVFLEQLTLLSPEQRQAIEQALRESDQTAIVRTAFELSAAAQDSIAMSLTKSLARQFELSYEVDPELICGIELQAGGYKIAWSVREALESLTERFSEVLDDALTFETTESR